MCVELSRMTLTRDYGEICYLPSGDTTRLYKKIFSMRTKSIAVQC